ncbi:MAG: hypothetical protein U1F26_18160 [Lysobacterales bacterium]
MPDLAGMASAATGSASETGGSDGQPGMVQLPAQRWAAAATRRDGSAQLGIAGRLSRPAPAGSRQVLAHALDRIAARRAELAPALHASAARASDPSKRGAT